jgi:hypothetical protein
MSLTYFETEDAIVTISDEAVRRYESEQDMPRTTTIHTAIFAGSAIGLVVTFAALVVTKIWGA